MAAESRSIKQFTPDVPAARGVDEELDNGARSREQIMTETAFASG